MGRPPCCDKSNVKKGPWTPEEDAKVLAYIANHGIGNWTLVPEKAGLNRCGKSCRLRWTNYLRPDLKHDAFTPQEEEYILKLHEAIGSRWSLIAKQLPGRTDNDVKNHWNTKLRKNLLKMEIDPVTHKPFSQILTDFGNISGFPNPRNHFEPLNNFINNNPPLKPEPSLTTLQLQQVLPMLNMPTTPQFQGNPFNNKFSWDNNSMAHLLASNQDTIQPHVFNEVSSTSSSSCNRGGTHLSSPPQSFRCQASSQIQTTMLPSSPSSWSDYLVADTTNVEQQQQQQEREFHGEMLPSYGVQNEIAREKKCTEATSVPAVDSFVDSILNRDTELQTHFPEFFLDGYI